MTDREISNWTRRSALGALGAGAGIGLAGFGWDSYAAEPPPETPRIRILHDPSVPALCWAPQYLAFELLKLEGFTEIIHASWELGQNESQMLDSGVLDLTSAVSTDAVHAVGNGAAIRILGGLHPGCIEMFAQDRIGQVKDLKGARLLSTHEGGIEYIFMSAMLSYIGLDPKTDVSWVFESDYSKWNAMFIEDKVDLVNAFVPLTYALHDTGVGHVLVNTTIDEPWRNFFCCMICASDAFVQKYPVATKRALRAYAKAQQLCADDPEGAARQLVELKATNRLDHARRVLSELPYDAWHSYDPAATVRFFALRLREAGLISMTPHQIAERGTEFSFIDELRKEMKT